MSDLIEKVAGDLGVYVRAHGALRLIGLRDTGRIVEACRSKGLLILGIEAFRLFDGKVIPDVDFIADYSELSSKEWKIAFQEAANSAEDFFSRAKNRADLWFDFNLRAEQKHVRF